MSPVDQALAKVLQNMAMAAKAGKLAQFSAPEASPDGGDSMPDDMAPPDAQDGLAGGAALDALGGKTDGEDQPDDETDPNDPSDDELEQLMQSK